MKAYRVMTEGGRGEWDEAEVPHAGPGEIVLQVKAAGLCRTDLEVMDHGAVFSPWTGQPFTLGHETAGTIVEVGATVSGLAVDDAVLVTANSSCGVCRNCRAGRDAFCLQPPPNYGFADDGGLAPYMKARSRDVLHLNSLDPRVAAPLADAGSTAYGALNDVRPFLRDDGAVAVIGVGGVGGVAVQLLKRLTNVRVIALDKPGRLGLAEANGADDTVASSPEAVPQVLDLTSGRGVDATIDIVGSVETLAIAQGITASLGAISVVGLAMGTAPFGFGTQRLGVRMFSSTTSSLPGLEQLIAVFERERLNINFQTYRFDDVENGYDDLRAEAIDGRAVVDFSLDEA